MPERKKILIVDDDPKILLMSKELLEMEGYEVSTHDQAFGTTNRAIKEQPDLVLLDINMPFLSGDLLAELIKDNRLTRNIPIVFYSSNDETSLAQMATRYQVRGYICKGDLVQLRRKVRYYLSKTIIPTNS
ncbi:response regulator [bacterium]|nr:response regulator [bacterium]